ncbi:hypothetical protein F66182_6404 [Fusarium sp. NRRL 66182]|nr:hypothetical protein F66182_6404 [Fusarium sp. NRRL 66182]
MAILDTVAPMQTDPPTTFDLERRQATSDQITITIAPDNVCGFISERMGASRACPVDDHCYFFPPVPSLSFENGGVLCCGSTSCQYHATCIDSKATDTASPFCNTVSWSGNTVDYWCNDVDITTAQVAALTYRGQKPRSFTTIDEDDVSSLQSQISAAKTGGNAVGEATRASEPSATETSVDENSSSAAPTGAIVGGAVGGVATIAILGLAIFFFLRRKKKQSQATSHSAYQPAPRDDNGAAVPENKGAWPHGQQQGVPYCYDPNTPSTVHSMASPGSQYMQTQFAGYQSGYQLQQPAIHEADGEALESKPQELADTGHGRREAAELA